MSEYKSRIGWQEYQKLAPEANAALTALSAAVSNSGLEKDLIELIKVRASQINRCAFCTQYHLNMARQIGVETGKLDLLAAWRDAGIFSLREQAALAWTERLTLIASEHVADEDHALVSEQFSRNEIVALTTAIGLINAWNRIAGPLQFAPPIVRQSKPQVQEPVHA